jgi:hypothetical protein
MKYDVTASHKIDIEKVNQYQLLNLIDDIKSILAEFRRARILFETDLSTLQSGIEK